MRAALLRMAEQTGIPMSEEQAEQFMIYMRELLQYNEHTNLTAITDSRDVMEKHFIDSLLLLKACEIQKAAKVADVGSGAGFPGMPLLIMRPDLNMTLLDSSRKRIAFLTHLCYRLELQADLQHMRAEEAGKKQSFRQNFDLVTARAVAGLPQLAEYCLPLVKLNGIFAAMKGPSIEVEINTSEYAVNKLGGQIQRVWSGELPGGDARKIILIEKVKATPKLYPRTANAIQKRPLYGM